MILAGIDYSMRSPSVCIFTGTEKEAFTFERCRFHFLTDTKKYANFFLTKRLLRRDNQIMILNFNFNHIYLY